MAPEGNTENGIDPCAGRGDQPRDITAAAHLRLFPGGLDPRNVDPKVPWRIFGPRGGGQGQGKQRKGAAQEPPVIQFRRAGHGLCASGPDGFRPHLILSVAHLLHPFHRFPVLVFLDGDVSHGRRGCGAVPVLLPRGNQITSPGLISSDQALLPLGAAASGHHDQGLAQGMGMPCRSSTGLEGYAVSRCARRIRRLKQRINSHGSRKPLGGPRSLRAASRFC